MDEETKSQEGCYFPKVTNSKKRNQDLNPGLSGFKLLSTQHYCRNWCTGLVRRDRTEAKLYPGVGFSPILCLFLQVQLNCSGLHITEPASKNTDLLCRPVFVYLCVYEYIYELKIKKQRLSSKHSMVVVVKWKREMDNFATYLGLDPTDLWGLTGRGVLICLLLAVATAVLSNSSRP